LFFSKQKKIKKDENEYQYNRDYSVIEEMKLEHFKTIRIYERNMDILRQCLKEKSCNEWDVPSTSDDVKEKKQDDKNEIMLKDSFQNDFKSKNQEETFRLMLTEEKDLLKKKEKDIEEREKRLAFREERLKMREENLLLREYKLSLKEANRQKNTVDTSLRCDELDLITNGSNDADSNSSTTDPLMNVEIQLNELDVVKKDRSK